MLHIPTAKTRVQLQASKAQELFSAGNMRAAQVVDLDQEKAMKFRFGNGDQPLPGFTIKRGVGIGGFGEVYFAVSDAGKEVALKQVQRNLEVEVRGVRQCMNLKHPNLLALYDIRLDAHEQGWIVMEYMAGLSLRDKLEAYPHGLPAEEIKHWFGQIVAAVAYLHDHGIVHRDLKPANIFEEQGIVKLGDYGLTKFISCSRRGGQTESVGTFHYMAPEIGKGEYGKEIDIYALGIILYELATGVVPFDGESSQEIIMKHLTADPDLRSLASHIRPAVARALAKNPASRFKDAREMLLPLGMEIDERYMPIRTPRDIPDGLEAEPPVCVAARGFGNQPSSAAEERSPQATVLRYEEPIARGLQRGWLELNRWWTHLRMNPSLKTLLLVLGVIFCAANAGFLLSLLVVGAMLYVPYYAVWWTLRAPRPRWTRQADSKNFIAPEAANRNPPSAARQARAEAHKGSVSGPAYAPEPQVNPVQVVPGKRPLSAAQWRVAKRMQLARIPRWTVLSEVTGSWLGAAGVLAVFSVLTVLFQIGSGPPIQPQLISIIWVAMVALPTAWLGIALGKLWQSEEGDWALRSFTQLTIGFAIGAWAYLLAEFLMVPWPAIARENMGELPVHRWSGFFASDGRPLLPAYLAYFPLLMGMIHWWKQVDPLRRTRFSIWSVMWSIIAASLVHLLIPFPQPMGALIAAGTSIAIQLSSPWINPAARLQTAGRL